MRGGSAEDIAATLLGMLAESPTEHAELQQKIPSMAASAVRKFGESRQTLTVPPAPAEYDERNPPPGDYDAHESTHAPKNEPDRDTQRTEPLFRKAWEVVAEKRETTWLLHKVLEGNVLAVLVGPRGTFKSFIGLDWLMHIALTGKTVVILSGEGAGLDRRIDAWMRTHAPEVELRSLKVLVLERPLNLGTSDMRLLTDAIEALPDRPAVVMVDTFSKFSAGLDENDNGEVAAYLGSLSKFIREAFACTVLLVVHSGHSDGKRPRGASVLMCNPDAEYVVERKPDDMTVTISRERFKDGAALPPVAYQARVVDLGRDDQYGERVTSLALESTDAPVAPHRGTGRNQEKALTALKEWCRANVGSAHITSMEITAIFKAQSIHAKRKKEVLEYLVAIRVITPSVGGYTIDKAML
jgi:hypothetical protein